MTRDEIALLVAVVAVFLALILGALRSPPRRRDLSVVGEDDYAPRCLYPAPREPVERECER